MFDVFSTYSIQLLSFLAAVVFIAGCIRGFAGFGAGMFFIPLATSVVSPPIAAASFLVIDGLVALPLLKNAVRICDWRTVLPAVLGSVLFVHAGAYLLASTDPLLLRWIIFAIVTSLLLLLVITIPCYAAGLLVGAKGFSASDPRLYKRIAYILIGLSAITSIPLLDPYLR
ncbi:conserved hypothetical protein [Roseibium sp. TrichSKD4]|uniref:sulfite exporter TauE/SafE family protein n=1 Tax=Roseibium sp. TrichSKD4 TaxID=744980 RepID=UPI0001E56D80|nr:sulfite exporter TauE/SafE family protein [Roseibium sp. TrichSKD4]EFO31506.1 conserved hypothetical protein [Roseibium sp. TrichSKD4]